MKLNSKITYYLSATGITIMLVWFACMIIFYKLHFINVFELAPCGFGIGLLLVAMIIDKIEDIKTGKLLKQFFNLSPDRQINLNNQIQICITENNITDNCNEPVKDAEMCKYCELGD